MTAVSDVFRGSVAAAAVAAEAASVSEGGGARTRGRASVAATDGDGNRLVATVVADVREAWVWHDSPPALAEVIAARKADPTKVPGGNPALRHAWTAYNHIVAIPATAVGYLLTWICQHPARLAVAAVLLVPLLLVLTA